MSEYRGSSGRIQFDGWAKGKRGRGGCQGVRGGETIPGPATVFAQSFSKSFDVDLEIEFQALRVGK